MYSSFSLIISALILSLVTLLISLTICGQISILRGVKIRRKRGNWDLNRLNTVIISPVVEEILFRGIFYEWVLSLDMNNKEKLFIIVSGGVFALLHNYSNLKQLIEKFCVGGIIYSHIFLWNKNLFLVIMVHVFHNLFVVYLTESYLEGADCGGK